jgi:DNA invertase Pin-like site-specific DNA recombinase
MKTIIYTRFSPRPHADECKSNEKQEERCRAYCKKHDYIVFRVCGDAAVSGKLIDRPGLSAAMASLEPGMVLVVDTSCRLARDMLVNLTIRHQVDQAGCTIEFADGSPTASTPEGELFQNILAAFAAYDRARFARRTKAGLAKKQANGEWLGKPPVGFRIDKETRRLVEHHKEQRALAQIRWLSKQGWQSIRIADSLTLDFGPFRGKPWSARTIRKILARDAE